MTAPCLQPTDSPVPEVPRYRAAVFQFPGRPLPLARRLAVYNRVKRILRGFMEEQRFNEVPAPALGAGTYLERMLDRGFPAVWSECQLEIDAADPNRDADARGELIRAMGANLDRDSVLELQRGLLRRVVEGLGADLLGGRQITRLDRVLTCEHACLEYEQVREILAERGHPVSPDREPDADSLAALARFFHNQPILVTGLPAAMAATALGDEGAADSDREHHGYVLPYAGLTIVGTARPGGFALNLSRLLQFLMGLERIEDTVISPSRGLARI